MKLSVLIPAHNEEGSIRETVEELFTILTEAHIPHDVRYPEEGQSGTETLGLKVARSSCPITIFLIIAALPPKETDPEPALQP